MRKIIFLFTAALFATTLQAQEKKLKEVIRLKMPLTVDDDMPGTRGANVAWHPLQKKYYAVFAGNRGYPLAVFDAKGTRLSKDTVVAIEDVRGLWYNPDTKTIQGNCYDEGGWFSYVLNSAGIPVSTNLLLDGLTQPDAQSVGAFNYKDKQVIFHHEEKIHMYDMEGFPVNAVDIYYGSGKVSGDELVGYEAEDYNRTAIVYTGIPKSEVGLLNTYASQIELYDIKTGLLTKTLDLPEEAPIESNFNFAYTNGIYWLFSIAERTWIGYK